MNLERQSGGSRPGAMRLPGDGAAVLGIPNYRHSLTSKRDIRMQGQFFGLRKVDSDHTLITWRNFCDKVLQES